MRRARSVRLALVTAMVSAVAVAAMPANAAAQGVASVIGTGTISPGLLPTGTNPQTFDLAGSGALATTDTTINGALICKMDGDDSVGTYAQGAGLFNGYCDTVIGRTAVAGSYTRTVSFVSVTGAASGALSGTFTGECAFSPTRLVADTGQPTATRIIEYAVSCDFTINI